MIGLQELTDSEYYKGVAAYLATGTSAAGQLLHTSVIMSSAATEGVVRKGYSWIGKVGILTNATVANALNEIETTLMDPNIEGIPIRCTKHAVSRSVSISESATIVQNGYHKEYNVDNAVPHLRQWTLTGYLTTLAASLGIDIGHSIKPSIVLQMKYLDALSVSRQSCMFKTNNNEFVRVQIEQLNMSQAPEALNAAEITMVLKEYKPLEASSFMQNVNNLVRMA